LAPYEPIRIISTSPVNNPAPDIAFGAVTLQAIVDAAGAVATRCVMCRDLLLPLPFCSVRIQCSGPPGSVEAEVSSVESKGNLLIDSYLQNEGNGWTG
jgi:hypothetical protein